VSFVQECGTWRARSSPPLPSLVGSIVLSAILVPTGYTIPTPSDPPESYRRELPLRTPSGLAARYPLVKVPSLISRTQTTLPHRGHHLRNDSYLILELCERNLPPSGKKNARNETLLRLVTLFFYL